MAEQKRQLTIKTKSVKRLAGDVRSYLSEKATLQSKLETLQASSSSEAGELRRAREFVEEAEATIQDVRQRLQESYTGLERFMEELEQAGDAEVLADQCFVDARQMLVDVASLVTVVADEHKDRGFKIAIFGGSQLTEDDALWRPTEQLGESLARNGYHVLTGGYAGTAESVAFGASRVSGSKIEGVTCANAFPVRSSPNQYINVETKTNDIHERDAALIRHSDAFVVMPGSLGTLSKFLLAWNTSAVETWASKPHLTILAWKNPWQSVISNLTSALHIPQNLVQSITYVESVDQVILELEKMKQHKKQSKLGPHGSAATSSSAAS